MSKLNVAIIFGGKSGEHEVSITSAQSIYKALDKEKYNVSLIGIDKNGRWLISEQAHFLGHSKNPRLLKLNEAKQSIGLVCHKSEQSLIAMDDSAKALLPGKIDVYFPIVHGTNGEDGTLQGMLEMAGAAYVGSGVLASSVGMDKDIAKKLLHLAGVPVVKSLTIKKYDFESRAEYFVNEIMNQIGLPCFVKPANMGSSVGVFKIKSKSEMMEKLSASFEYDNKVLVEVAIEARELECSVLGNNDPKASIIGEIIPKHEFYSYEAKYIDSDGADLAIPAKDLSPELIAKLQNYAIAAFKALDCSGLARVDFFLDKNNSNIYLNEVNTLPGFTSISMYPKLWEASGLGYKDLLDQLIYFALEKHKEKKSLKTSFDAF